MQKRIIIDLTLSPLFKRGIKLFGSSLLTITNEDKSKKLSLGIGYFRYYSK